VVFFFSFYLTSVFLVDLALSVSPHFFCLTPPETCFRFLPSAFRYPGFRIPTPPRGKHHLFLRQTQGWEVGTVAEHFIFANFWSVSFFLLFSVVPFFFPLFGLAPSFFLAPFPQFFKFFPPNGKIVSCFPPT